jgi:hypothetical protein
MASIESRVDAVASGMSDAEGFLFNLPTVVQDASGNYIYNQEMGAASGYVTDYEVGGLEDLYSYQLTVLGKSIADASGSLTWSESALNMIEVQIDTL